jgi:plastocyanin
MMAARKEQMSRRKYARAGIVAAAAVITAAIAIPALAAAPTRVTQKMVGGGKFVPNRSVSDTMHFKKDRLLVAKGGKVALVNTTGAPHTFSLVTKRQVPQKLAAVDACFEKGPCGKLAVEHGAVNPDTGEEQDPTVPLVNKGKAGFNQPGDSIIIPPHAKRSVAVTSGQSLYYICAIHPWMLGAINAPAPR